MAKISIQKINVLNHKKSKRSSSLKFHRGDNCKYIGIDGCGGKGGMWLTVALFNGIYEINRIDTIGDLYQIYDDNDVVLIDVPIGLSEDLIASGNRPDAPLRKELKGKASSVFNTPFRPVVYEPDKKKAQDLSKKIGKGISVQSLAIRKYIIDVDTFLRENEEYKNVIMESHPEFCFKLLNNGITVLSKKSTNEGLQERIEILKNYFHGTETLLEEGMIRFGRNKKIKGDILDALCLSICAKLGSDNGFNTIPEDPVEDKYGIRMQIVYPVV